MASTLQQAAAATALQHSPQISSCCTGDRKMQPEIWVGHTNPNSDLVR